MKKTIINKIIRIYNDHLQGKGTSWEELAFMESMQDFILATPELLNDAGLCEFAGIDEQTRAERLNK